MKKEYDFSKGERGKFFKPDSKFNIPIYLEENVRIFVENIADKRRCDVSTVVNDLLKSDMRLADAMK